MDTRQLQLGFKGQRSYIQGGDIFNAATAIAREAGPEWFLSVLAFRHFARGDCDLHWSRPAPEATLIGHGVATDTSAKRPFWITESQRPATGRNPYDCAPSAVVGPDRLFE